MIHFQNLTYTYPGAAQPALRDIALHVPEGGFALLVGPSGCGKSTLLRMMAGLEELSGGEIDIDSTRCDHLLPSARGMAMVFQSYALYPHMSVEQNLRFGLENQKLPRAEISARVQQAAQILQIEHLLKRRPNQLSGGQSQRVAIGRAIVKEPKAFLLDEPLSNLDAELRVKMRGELVALHQRLGVTMVYVTHDQVEAMTMANKIVVLREGVIEQAGTPIELYTRPANQFVAGFLGAPQMNFLPGIVAPGGDLVVRVDEGRATLHLPRSAEANPGTSVTVGIRPEHLSISANGALTAKVEQVELLGAETIIHSVLSSGAPIIASLRGISELRPGATVRLAADGRHVHLFDGEGVALPDAQAAAASYATA
jgi:ABC-type sugar transport system ATPase subunit